MTTALQNTNGSDPFSIAVRRESLQTRIREVLGQRSAQFTSSLVSLVNANYALKKAEPDSVVAAAMTAALLDLPINKDLGFAHIVPYSGKAQFQMGYKGFIQLAMRTGQYRHLNACEVYEGEFVSYSKLTGELVLKEDGKTSETVVGYAAYMELVNGFRHAIYWPAEKVQAHSQRYSQAVKSKKQDSPWFTNFDAMALKTVIKSLLSKWGILSIELQRAMEADQGALSPDGSVTYLDNPKEGEGDGASQTEGKLLGAGAEDPRLPEAAKLDLEDACQRAGYKPGKEFQALAESVGAKRWAALTVAQAEKVWERINETRGDAAE
jgi:recombination protein RecT